MPVPRSNEDNVVLAHHTCLALDLHQAFAVQDVIDLLLNLVDVAFHVGHRLVGRYPKVHQLRPGGLRSHQRLR